MAMPVTGRKPKPQGQAVTRHKQVHDWTEVVEVPFHGGRSLPVRQPDGKPWPPQTKRWWKTISSMPHCVLWADADWMFAEHTARLVARFDIGDTRLAKEIRDRERVLGTTVDYRRDLRIRYVPEVAEVSADVVSLDDYRNL
ncbi:MAG: hypothetical protein LBV06_07110 [Propionibacteriaceae bacterium]|nr:hypothetical protein [Propionibacteriaceae bacterium]